MPRKRRDENTALHPIMTFIILILIVICVSGILGAAGLSTNYNMINTTRGGFDTITVSVNSLLSLSGLKWIFSNTVASFSSFAPLTTLIITLIGIGIMDKSGFLQSFFTLLTQKAKKNRVTFFLSLLTVVASIIGDISFIVLIPIIALFFKYSKRNPKAGIIMTFAGLTCGTSINIFMNSIESSLLEYTRLAANSLDATYQIGNWSYLFVMVLATLGVSYVISVITEKYVIPKLGKYGEDDDEEAFYLDKRKKRGLIFSLGVASIYLLIFIYNIIPGLPLSGNLLDYSQTLYIDKLFGYNSFFNQGFVFVITILFFLCGLFYGIGAKTIKNNRDVCSFLGHSLDDIGKTLVLIFFAATLISIFKETNIGTVLAALIADFMANAHFTGLPLIFSSFIAVAIITLFVPSPITSWSIISGVMVPVFMNAGMTAEFAELIFRVAQSITYGLTPLMAYFVIYLAFLEKYSDDGKQVNLFGAIKFILPYSGATFAIWLLIIILFYILGIPMGFGASPIL